MALTWQKGILFVGGLALGVAAGVMGVLHLRDGNGTHSPAATRTLGAAPAARPAAPAASVPLAKVEATECEVAPLLPKKGSDDGQASLQSHPGTGSAGEVSSLILSGKEADAAGRQRDAEVLFLNACRNAAQVQGDPLPLADAMYQLARHYANAAAFGAQPAAPLFERAERLYSASLLTYQARLGAKSEKTKFAQEGLKTVQQVTGRSGPVAPVAKAAPPAPVAAPTPAAPAPVAAAPAPAPAPARAPAVAKAPEAPKPAAAAHAEAPKPPPAVHAEAPKPAPQGPSAPAVAAAPAPKEAARSQPAEPPKAPATAVAVPESPPPTARRTQPSFDCARARSTNEKLICANEDLARQDRELGRLHQRAKQAAADPRAFQRESDAEWTQREQNCHDRDCLERWYAQRRAELGAQAARPAAPVARSRPSQGPSEAAAPPEPAVRPAPVARAPAPRADGEARIAAPAPHVTAPRRPPPDNDEAPPPRAPATEALGAPGTASGGTNVDTSDQ